MPTYHLQPTEKGDLTRHPPPYTVLELKNALLDSVKEVYRNDDYLIRCGLSERTLTVRLAMYLQQAFPDYDVDGEYNKNLEDPKRYTRADGRTANAEPDVLVHLRGRNHPFNLIAVEAKRVGRMTPVDRERDREKLTHFVNGLGAGQEYRYHLGAFVDFDLNCFHYEFFHL